MLPCRISACLEAEPIYETSSNQPVTPRRTSQFAERVGEGRSKVDRKRVARLLERSKARALSLANRAQQRAHSNK
jgi:hypothetical protein